MEATSIIILSNKLTSCAKRISKEDFNYDELPTLLKWLDHIEHFLDRDKTFPRWHWYMVNKIGHIRRTIHFIHGGINK